MANDTRSSNEAKDDKNNNGRHSGPSAASDNGLKSSARETSSKKVFPGPSSSRESERLVKGTLPTPAVRRKSERFEKQNMPSMLRRSRRTKYCSHLTQSHPKNSGSPGSKQKKPKKEKVSENEKKDVGTSHGKSKRMDARAFRATFKPKAKIGCHEELTRVDKLTQKGGNNDGGKIDGCFNGSHLDCKAVSNNGMLASDEAKAKEMNSRLRGPVKEPLESNVTLGSLGPFNVTTYEMNGVPQSVQDDGEETLRMLLSRNSKLNKKLVRNTVGQEIGQKLITSKRKGSPADKLSGISTISNQDNYTVVADAATPRACECKAENIVGTCETCSKRIRLDHDPTVSCNTKESVNPFATEDRGEIEAVITGIAEKGMDYMLQKEVSTNIQTVVDGNICLICKRGGQLLVCGGAGCNGCYHFYCLEPPMVDASLGVWYCHLCVRKKIELGVYSVSEGVESIWDAREVDSKGLTTQKEFFLKYKGLAHVHNCWVPESQLLLEAPLMLMEFNQKNQALRWKPEWALPHRLLLKRSIFSTKQHGDHRSRHAVDNFDCHNEWLVKWRDLGYENATWELDNASFLHSSEGQSLISNYEDCHQRAKRVSLFSKIDKILDPGQSIDKLSQMPGGVSSGCGNNNLDAVNKLREHWHKGQNSIVIDDHRK